MDNLTVIDRLLKDKDRLSSSLETLEFDEVLIVSLLEVMTKEFKSLKIRVKELENKIALFEPGNRC